MKIRSKKTAHASSLVSTKKAFGSGAYNTMDHAKIASTSYSLAVTNHL